MSSRSSRGRIAAFGALLMVASLVPAVTVSGQVDPLSLDLTLEPGESHTETKVVDVPSVLPKADVYFLADTTGSMGPILDAVKADAAGLLADIDARVGDVQFGVGDYKDFPYDAVSNPYAFRQGAPIGAAADALAAIADWSTAPGQGGDTPEGQFYALDQIASSPETTGWRTDSSRIVVWFGDAPAHDEVCVEISGGLLGDPVSEASLIAKLTAEGITVNAISTNTGISGALNGDPSYQNFDYSVCEFISTVSGQAGRIATATGGLDIPEIDSTTIVGAIVASIEDLTFEITADSSTCSPLAVDFTPDTQVGIPGSTVSIDETIRVPEGTSPGVYACTVEFFASGSLIGTQTISVTVPSPEPEGMAYLQHAVVDGGYTLLTGRVETPEANATGTLLVYTGDVCSDGVLGGSGVELIPMDSVSLTTDENGDAFFSDLRLDGTAGTFVAATFGVGHPPNPCIRVGFDNTSWTRALTISTGATLDGWIETPGETRWYKVPISPGAQVTVNLTSLPENYNLAVFRDIGLTFLELAGLSGEEDLTELSAEFAPDMFSPDMFSPDMFSPDMFSPDMFSPDMFSPDMFSPDMFSPDMFSPDMFSPDMFSPDMFSPDMFSPDMFSPDMFSPDMFSPDMFSPDMFSPDMFSPENFALAQLFSLVALGLEPGTADELVIANTWNNTGFFYMRVSGVQAASDAEDPFTLTAAVSNELCPALTFPASRDSATSTVSALILWDSARIDGTAAEIAALGSSLSSLATATGGDVVDLAGDVELGVLHSQADGYASCVFAKNLVARGIKNIVDSYRNPDLRYVVLVGGDSTIPFFRYPDDAGLAPELNYHPPVAELTPSQASLRLNYILGQDEYGSKVTLNQRATQLPVPDLAVGRLVETAADAKVVVDAYLADGDGVVSSSSHLTTGYDFLSDAAEEVRSQLVAGTGEAGSFLIDPATTSPQNGWTADQLRAALFDSGRHDLVFLAGHFSASSALAADYATRVTTADLAASTPGLFTNSIVFSAGCHSGYNTVDGDAIPLVTQPLDWAQAFAQKGATLIAGTGYQYGDSDFIKYSERIYANFAAELRTGSGPVSVGEALVRAKQEYLKSTQSLQGLHRKSLVISTLFGLPMLSVDMPNRLDVPVDASIVDETYSFPEGSPGAQLGTSFADVSLGGTYTPGTVTLKRLADGAEPPFTPGDYVVPDITATYYEGPDGVVANPGTPAVPLVSANVSVPGQVLRGIGFRGGSYSDSTVVPLTGAPATELRGLHSQFASELFFPMRLARANYYGALTNTGGTRLLLTPAQHKVANLGDLEATLRLYSNVDLRLYYSDLTGPQALASPPVISSVVTDDAGNLQVIVVGDPTAGIQEVWATYTTGPSSPGTWQSVDLTQDTTDSRVWAGSLPPGAEFVVQAVNGVGLVTMSDNYGAYYQVAAPPATPPAPTSLVLNTPPSSGTFGASIVVSATLTGDGSALAGQRVRFSLGGSSRVGVTNSSGVASAVLRLLAPAGSYPLRASFAGTDAYAPSAASAPFAIQRSGTTLTIDPNPIPLGGDPYATLTGANGVPLKEKTVYFRVTSPSGAWVGSAITDVNGVARFDSVDLSAGVYEVTAAFGTVLLADGIEIALPAAFDPFYTASRDQLFLAVYDPSAGFVTGGGWIWSPAGAYTADPSLDGKASFGFVSKYKKGKTTPEGDTQFQFKAADLHFESSVYEWLVVAGTRAQFKGYGTVNGVGVNGLTPETPGFEAYRFFLVGIDDDAGDQFRIKIWSEDGAGLETVVYDNGLGADENASTATELGGGSIVIHTGGKKN